MHASQSHAHEPTPSHPTSADQSLSTVVIIVEQDSLIGRDLRWPLRIARLRKADITLVLRGPKNAGEQKTTIDLSMSTDSRADGNGLAGRIRTMMDEYLGPEQWTAERDARDGESGSTETDAQAHVPLVQLRLADPRRFIESLRQAIEQGRSELVLFVGGRAGGESEEWMGTIRAMLRLIAIPVSIIVPGTRQNDGQVLVAAGRGSHGRAAMELAGELAVMAERDLTALFVEPDIGPDAAGVGRRILNRLLEAARDEKLPAQFAKRVVVHNDPAKGIIEACREESFEALILGATRVGAFGEWRLDTVPNRVLRSKPDATLIAVRAAVPLRRQLFRLLESRLLRRVPQLTREGRVTLVERIQTNAQWNFDFVLLIALSTVIAALGLLDNSPAVIIGAMLVAPLMTPLLGMGLAIAQGNSRFARMTLKATCLGFATALVLAFAIGLMFGEFRESTSEMDARDWPQMLDLIVAFLSGIAAAYASGRPGLLAALPGVAIAAALLPPVATSGLAMSVGDFDLALGALLLFAVNMVAIVIAAILTLRIVGVRDLGKVNYRTRLLGHALLLVTIAATLALTFAPPTLEPKRALVNAVESAIADEYRLRRIRLHREPQGLTVQVDLGGSRLPDSELNQQLSDIAHEYLDSKAGVRVTFRYEALVN